MKTVTIEIYYSREYQINPETEITPELLDGLEESFAESLDTQTILDNLDTTMTELVMVSERQGQ